MSLNDSTMRKDEERWIAHFEQLKEKEKLTPTQKPPLSPVKKWMNTIFIYGKNIVFSRSKQPKCERDA